MHITCISDLHGHFPILKGGDLLLIAGDLTLTSHKRDVEKFFKWLRRQRYQKKVFISGNHDVFDVSLFDVGDATYLLDSGTEFEGLKIWGSPWTLRFANMNPHCMAFTVDNECELGEKLSVVPDDIDILLTHSPAYTILDCTLYNGMVGSHALYGRVCEIKPLLHVFGHIHEVGGSYYTLKHDASDTLCVNASYVNAQYSPGNPIIELNYDKTTKRMTVKYEEMPKMRSGEARKRFHADKRAKYGLNSWCKTCKKQHGRGWKLKWKYNISLEDYDQMYDLQNGSCAICGNHHDVLCVDHCHTFGHVRGLLCDLCNRSIGYLKESIPNLSNAIKYLLQHQQQYMEAA